MSTLLIFIVVLGGMIFLHELGHFLAARLFKIEIEEFGFGIPPRATGLWRGEGYLLLNQHRVEIPKNFERGFDWQRLLDKSVTITVDSVDGKFVLRTLEATETEPAPVRHDHVEVGSDGQTIEQSQTNQTTLIKLGNERGSIKWEDTLHEAHPGTLVSLNWLPLGGFVRARGEADPSVPGGLMAANPWKRLGVFFAGPIMNLLTATVIFGALIAANGVAAPPIRIEEVTPASPAEKAGLQANDLIVAINGVDVTGLAHTSALIQQNLDKPIDLTIDRNGKQLNITATPLSSRSPQEGALGVALMSSSRPATVDEVITGGLANTGIQAASLVYLPVALIQGTIQPDEARLSGLKGIYDLLGSAVQRDTQTRQEAAAQPPSKNTPPVQPTDWTLYIVAALSVSLGVLNLMPIPALDGGRILFTLPEILFRRRIPTEYENMINGVAMLLLIALMIFINVMDFVNPAHITIP